MQMKLYTVAAVFALALVACNNGGGGGKPSQPDTPKPFDDITAAELVANIRIGVNWSDRLDACDHGDGWMGKNWTVNEMETAWGNPAAAQAAFTARKNAGFNAIRIPVTWYKAADSNYNIRADWMKRVTDVVNYAASNDMYVILNTHHDEHIFKFTNAQLNTSLLAFRKIWEQIAGNFQNYDEKLIFEALNEPRTIGAAHEWSGNAEEYANLNKYYEAFVDVVRNSGGNNGKRILMINTYAARYEQAAVQALVLPADPAPNKFIVSVHGYEPFDFAYHDNMGVTTWSSSNAANTKAIHDVVQSAYDKFVSKGTPVIIGEFAAADKNNASTRAEWAEYYVRHAKSKGIPCFWWDNGIITTTEYGGMAIFDKNNNSQPYPEIVTALMRGAGN